MAAGQGWGWGKSFGTELEKEEFGTAAKAPRQHQSRWAAVEVWELGRR
jgi:hypothetical protein